MHSNIITALAIILIVFSGPVWAEENEQLNDIYRLFLRGSVDVSDVSRRYHSDVIHVGQPAQALIAGRDAFLAHNIVPLAEMVNSGQMEFTGTVHIVRRIVSDSMANDVGYLHSVVTVPGREPIEQVQKFSWVFIRDAGQWKVITDFDATPASLEVLGELSAEIVIN